MIIILKICGPFPLQTAASSKRVKIPGPIKTSHICPYISALNLPGTMKAFAAISTVLFLCSNLTQAQVDTAAISEKLNRSAKQLGKDFVCLVQKDGKIIYKKESSEFNVKTQHSIGAASQMLTA